jgi:cell division GTPase FtsZ
MPYLFVGAGQAGSAIVDEVFGHKNISKIAHPIVFNSTIRDLQNLSNIGSEHWYGVAEQHGLIRGGTAGFEERVTGGFGRNPVQADQVMSQHRDGVWDVLDEQLGESTTEEEVEQEADIPFAFIFVGLGGGTGCGISSHIAEEIKDYTNGVTRIIAVCVLPNTQGPVGEDEMEATPSRQAWNARYGLNQIEDAVDGIVLVDNQRLAYHNAAEGQFTEYNRFIADGIVDMVSGPILERIDRSDYDVDPPIIDLQDIITSLSLESPDGSTDTGYASLSRSVMMTQSLPGYLLPFVGRQEITATDLWDRARLKQTLEDVDMDDTQKAIGLLRAPSGYIRDNEYRIDTSKFRSTLTMHCNEVNLGVTLTKRNLASFTALLTFSREEISRITEIERLAEEYEQESGAPAADTVAAGAPEREPSESTAAGPETVADDQPPEHSAQPDGSRGDGNA